MTMSPERPRVVTLPPVYCPLEPTVPRSSEDVAAIDARVVDWLVRTGVRGRDSWIEKINATYYTFLCYPYITDALAEAITKVMYLLGSWDDDLEDDSERRDPPALAAEISGLMRAFEYPKYGRASHRPYERAMASFRLGLDLHMSRSQYGWFREELRRYMSATLWKNIVDQREELLELDEYLMLRMSDVAGLWMSALVPIAGGYDLPADWAHEARVRALCESTAVILGLDNDAVSYDRERLQGNFMQHIYPILMKRDALSLPDAVEATRKMRDRIMSFHLRLRDSILADSPPSTVAQFASTVTYIVRGNMTWSATTHRYTHPIDPRTGAEISHGQHEIAWTDQPSDPSTEPLDIPVIARWWDLPMCCTASRATN